jgi:4-hydroxybenzoate polyprenyltransferase
VTLHALFYDFKGKHMRIFGPINMGLCRAFNLMLGMSVYELGVLEHFYLIVIPLIYIAAITLVSRGEVHGSQSAPLWFAAILFIFVHASQIAVGYQAGKLVYMLPFVLIHVYLIFTKLIPAIKKPIGPNIGQTVKTGVLTLILMNAAWVSLSEQYYMAFVTLALLPISMWVGKKFAVS